MSGSKVCSQCKVPKPLVEFYEDASKSSGYQSLCKICKSIYAKEYGNTPEGFAAGLVDAARTSTKARKLKRGREDMEDCEMTPTKVLKLYRDQEGKDYYTGVRMFMSHVDDWQASLERLETKPGYIDPNTVLTALEMNGRRQWSVEKVKLLPQLVKQKVDMNQIDQFIESSKVKKQPRKRQAVKKIGKYHYLCSWCFKKRLRRQFGSKLAKGCEVCRKKERERYNSSFGGFITRCISNAKASTISRNEKNRNLEFSITFDDIIDLIRQQQARCAYSGIPLVFKPKSEWQMSIERLDNTIGYTRENICLICLEFNTDAHWSKEKFKITLDSIIDKYNL